ncbi:excisionase [Yersinia bercovieri]|uniref:excisionase n=1 Tax=Yersinia bercovieri TaxID=634 RepID=UPI00119FF291|nr:excisionase [Yersinia bercovieri]
MAKLLTLEEWCDETYKTNKPKIQTLQRWARNGNIYPAPEKHGKRYRVKPNAIYIDPKDFNLGKKIKDVQSAVPAQSAFMEKVINDSAAKV